MKRSIMALVLLFPVLFSSCGKNKVETLTYAVYPYLPDAGYYQDLIERRWAETEPDIKLIRAEWDCYYDELPDDVDVLMYDAVMRDTLIENGSIRPISPDEITNPDDIYPFALDGLTVDDKLYGIPVFLCGNFLMYDKKYSALAEAEHLTDLSDQEDIIVINSDNPLNRPQYVREVLADTMGEANPGETNDEDEMMACLDRLAVDAHKGDEDAQVAAAYDSGSGMGYIGFSESMRLLDGRFSDTGVRSISFSNKDDTLRLYVDAVAMNSKVDGQRYDKCIELMNIIADANVLSDVSVYDGKPQYLLLARKSPYEELSDRFPLYIQLEDLASDENNNVILGPRP